MNIAAWVIVIVIALPVLFLLGWLALGASFVRIPSGSLGLLMVRGQATDTLGPGPHVLPALRQRQVAIYPSVEMSYHAGGQEAYDDELDRYAAPLTVTLGDRTNATVSYTLRFRLDPGQLRDLHERVGPLGVFGAVRDTSRAAVSQALRSPTVGVDDLFGAAFEECQTAVGTAVADALRQEGFELTAFSFGAPDLGRTGEVIQATLRARQELEREQAEAPTRRARAANDADLQHELGLQNEDAWRYRETDLWTEMVQRTGALQLALRNAAPGVVGLTTTDRVDRPAADTTPPPASP